MILLPEMRRVFVQAFKIWLAGAHTASFMVFIYARTTSTQLFPHPFLLDVAAPL